MTYPSGVSIARMLAAAAAAAALLLSLAPAASASIWPAPAKLKAHAVHGLVLPRSRQGRLSVRACSAHAKVVRWLAPVACEQPPRSETLLVPLLGG